MAASAPVSGGASSNTAAYARWIFADVEVTTLTEHPVYDCTSSMTPTSDGSSIASVSVVPIFAIGTIEFPRA